MDPITVNALNIVGRVTVRDPNLGNTYALYNADFSGATSLALQFGNQSQGQIFGTVKSMFVDNGTNPSAVDVQVQGSDQFFTIPSYSIGYYTIDANAGSTIILTTAGGATDVCTVTFYNWERAPVVWYSFGAFNTDRPIKAQGTMDEGAVVASEPDNKPVYIGGIDRNTGEFVGVGVDALGRLDFSSSISIGGIFGADPMGAAPVNPGVVQAVLDSTGDIVYTTLESNGGLSVTQAPNSTGTQSSVASVNTDATILAANANRRGATIYNDSTQVLYILLSNAVSSNTVYTTQIDAGGYYEVPAYYSGIIKGIWAAANGAARVTEIT